MPSLEWYFPWAHVDWVLKLQLVVWLCAVVIGFWICRLGLHGRWLAAPPENDDDFSNAHEGET